MRGGVYCSDHHIVMHDFDYTVSINSLGIRDREIDPARRAACRILAIGDSYTFGYGVALEETWVKRLEHYLREAGIDAEVFNGGEAGDGPIAYSWLAEVLVPKLAPDLVLVGLLQGNDLVQSTPELMTLLFPHIERVMRYRRADWSPPPVPPGERMQFNAKDHQRDTAETAKFEYGLLDPAAQARIDALDPEVNSLLFAGLLNPYMMLSAATSGDVFTIATQPDSVSARVLGWVMGVMLGRIQRTAEAFGGQAIALSIPNGIYDNRVLFDRLKRLGHEMNPKIMFSTGPDQIAARSAAQAGTGFIEATQAFRDQADDGSLYFEMDHHFTAAGHDLYARSIAAQVAAYCQVIN